MQYYIHHNNEQIGPFTEAQVKAKLAAGEVSASDHVWWQGQQGWVPLSQTPLAGPGMPAIPATPVIPGTPAAAAYPTSVVAPSSKLALWSLICGCLSLVCFLFTSIPAIILGHMGLTEIKKNPGMQGKGMATAGMVIGYIMTFLLPILAVVAISVLIALGNQVKSVFTTITSQLSVDATSNSGTVTTTPDSTTNSADQSTNSTSTTSPDSSTNSSTTNAPASSTNSAPGQ